MEDQRDAHRLERRTGELGGAVLRGRDRQRRALDVREAAAAALEQRPVLDQAGDVVAFELPPIGRCQASRRKESPPSASIAATMRSWSARR